MLLKKTVGFCFRGKTRLAVAVALWRLISWLMVCWRWRREGRMGSTPKQNGGYLPHGLKRNEKAALKRKRWLKKSIAGAHDWQPEVETWYFSSMQCTRWTTCRRSMFLNQIKCTLTFYTAIFHCLELHIYTNRSYTCRLTWSIYFLGWFLSFFLRGNRLAQCA